MCVGVRARLSLWRSTQQPAVVLRHILGFPTEELQRGAVIQDLHYQLSQQMAYLHLIHWSVCESTPSAFCLESSVAVTQLNGSPVQ